MDKKNEIQLNNAPSDVISSCKFAPNSNQYLLVSSWDCTVRLYDTVNNSSRQKFSHEAPVLDCSFQVCIENHRIQKKFQMYQSIVQSCSRMQFMWPAVVWIIH